MNKALLTVVALSTFGVLFPATGQAAEFGDIKGQFVINGDVPSVAPLFEKGDPTAKDPEVCAAADMVDDSLVVNSTNKGVANIVLFLSKAPKEIHPDLQDPPAEPAVFDQEACRFFPHVLPVRAGQDVVVKSNDACAHNVRSSFIRNTSFNFTVQPKDRDGVKVEDLDAPEPLPMPIKCDIHPYMQSYWVILDHPYVAVTDADGNFEIKGLPEGKHKFRVWHERAGYLDRSFSVEVTAGQMNNLGKVDVDPADVAEKK